MLLCIYTTVSSNSENSNGRLCLPQTVTSACRHNTVIFTLDNTMVITIIIHRLQQTKSMKMKSNNGSIYKNYELREDYNIMINENVDIYLEAVSNDCSIALTSLNFDDVAIWKQVSARNTQVELNVMRYWVLWVTFGRLNLFKCNLIRSLRFGSGRSKMTSSRWPD